MATPSSRHHGDDRAVDPALRGLGLHRVAHRCTQRRERSCWTAVMTRMTTVITTEIEAA